VLPLSGSEALSELLDLYTVVVWVAEEELGSTLEAGGVITTGGGGCTTTLGASGT
jgi:hypothetical protein